MTTRSDVEEELRLAIESDGAARELCEAMAAWLAGGGSLPWPSLSRPYDEWVDALGQRLYADGRAQAVCRAIEEHVSHGGAAPRPVAEQYRLWAGIRRQLERERIR